MLSFYFLAIFVISIRPVDSHSCLNLLNSSIILVDKSDIELACQVSNDTNVSTIAFTNSENTSQSCTFRVDDLQMLKKDPDCFFGERISFIGNATEYKFRFRIRPVTTQGKDTI